jgi:enolase-phosphatase E1
VATYPNENVHVIDDSDRTDKDRLIDSIVKNIYWQIDLDKKTKALKQIQGHIWKSAYELGDIKGQ